MQKKIKATLSLRTYVGKKLVSLLRNGDYAHAGETEAIIKVMQEFKKDNHQTILDVGCGLGGTAYFIEKNGWGKVTGIDIENSSIDYARKTYSFIEFYVSDVIDLVKIFPSKQFDIICLFNSFYAFKDQKSALISLFKVSNKKTNLVIFDYSDPMKGAISPLFKEGNEKESSFKPIKLENIKSLLLSTGWHLVKIKDISNDYIRWYDKLLDKLSADKKNIISEFGQAAFKKAKKTYSEIHTALLNKKLGGVIIYAKK